MFRYNIEAIVLKNFNHKDSDKIYSLFSKGKGKIIATAKGVRKISSRRGGNLDTLNHVVIGISESKNVYKYISEVEAKNTFKDLKDSLENSSKGFYLVELVYKLTEEGNEDKEENKEIFELLLKCIKLLNASKVDEGQVVNFFEISLMKMLGYELSFRNCVSCNRAFSRDWGKVKMNFGLGGFVCDRCSTDGFQVTFEEALYLNTLNKNKFSANREDHKQADELLKMYIKNIAEDDFKSLSF